MKLPGKKRPEPQRPGRQRNAPDRSAAPTYRYLANRAERADEPDRRKGTQAQARGRMLSLRFWARRSGLLIAIVALVICLISILSVSSTPRVVIADERSAGLLRNSQDYEQTAASQLSSSIFNRNKLTIDTAGLARSLEQQHPELINVTVSLPLIGQRPIYYLEAAQPTFAFRAVNGNFIIDERGRALLGRPTGTEDTTQDYVTVIDQSGKRVERGAQVVSVSDVTFIETVIKTLAAKQVTVASMTLPNQNAQELDVRVAGQAYVVKFDTHQEGGAVRQQVGSYLATAQQLKRQNITPAEYIDVRVPGRVYYK